MTTIYDMTEKKEKPRSIRFEPGLWDLIVREARKAQRTPAGQIRFLLEKELRREGLLAAEPIAEYQTRAAPESKTKGRR